MWPKLNAIGVLEGTENVLTRAIEGLMPDNASRPPHHLVEEIR
jgi:hypothetical protein